MARSLLRDALVVGLIATNALAQSAPPASPPPAPPPSAPPLAPAPPPYTPGASAPPHASAPPWGPQPWGGPWGPPCAPGQCPWEVAPAPASSPLSPEHRQALMRRRSEAETIRTLGIIGTVAGGLLLIGGIARASNTGSSSIERAIEGSLMIVGGLALAPYGIAGIVEGSRQMNNVDKALEAGWRSPGLSLSYAGRF